MKESSGIASPMVEESSISGMVPTMLEISKMEKQMAMVFLSLKMGLFTMVVLEIQFLRVMGFSIILTKKWNTPETGLTVALKEKESKNIMMEDIMKDSFEMA